MNGDRDAGLFAALFVEHIRQKYPEALNTHLRWARTELPGDLGKKIDKHLIGAAVKALQRKHLLKPSKRRRLG